MRPEEHCHCHNHCDHSHEEEKMESIYLQMFDKYNLHLHDEVVQEAAKQLIAEKEA